MVISIPITLKGTDAQGSSFEEKTRTLVINKHGAKLASPHRLTLGTEVTIQNVAVKRWSKATVVWVSDKPGPGQTYEFAAELLNPQNLWGIDFPPEDWAEGAPTGAGGQRLQMTSSKAPVQRADKPEPPENELAEPAPGVETAAEAAVTAQPLADSPSGVFGEQRVVPGLSPDGPEIQKPAPPVEKPTVSPVPGEIEIPLPPFTDSRSHAAVQPKLPGALPSGGSARQSVEDRQAGAVVASRLEDFEQKLSELAAQIQAQAERSLEQAARRLEANSTASIEQKASQLNEVLHSTRKQFESLLADFRQLRETHCVEVEAARHDIKEETSQAVQDAVHSAIEELGVKTNTLVEAAQSRLQRSLQKLQEKAVREASDNLRRITEELADSLAKQLESHGEDTLELLFAELSAGGKKLADETAKQFRVATQSTLEALTMQAQSAQGRLEQLSERISSSTRSEAEESIRRLRGLAWATLDSLKADAQTTAEEFRREIKKACEEESAWAHEQVVAAARTSLQKTSKDLLETVEAQLHRQAEESIEQAGQQLQEKQQQLASVAEQMFRDAIAEILETIGRRTAWHSGAFGRDLPETFEPKKTG